MGCPYAYLGRLPVGKTSELEELSESRKRPSGLVDSIVTKKRCRDDDREKGVDEEREGRGKEQDDDGMGVFNADVALRSTAELQRARKEPLYYGKYLQLDKILSAQEPVSWKAKDVCHDELLFITIHQTYELWFKQLIFEIDSVRDIFAGLRLGEKQINTALHRLIRIKEIQKILVEQIRVLQTMSAQEFLDFRDYLAPASGFQSMQFRLIEVKLGLKMEQRTNQKFVEKLSEEDGKRVEEAIAEPSLFDYVERWLRNMPFREFRGYKFQERYAEAVEKMLRLDRGALERLLEGEARESALKELEGTRRIFESVYKREVHEEMVESGQRRLGFRATSSCLMIMLYREEPMLQLPAQLLQLLVDVDDNLNQWRYRHAQMVHRMIGVKVGTGGSLGFRYLKETVDRHRIFSDIANMSTLLIPRRFLPQLPAALRDQMKYFHTIEPYDRTLFELGGGGDIMEDLDWSFC